MTDVKAVEDLTLEEIKEQLAIYQRFYYHKKKQEAQYREAKKKSAEQRKKREILNKILEDNDKGIKIDDINLDDLNKKKGRKVIPVEKAVLLKTVKDDGKIEKEDVEDKKPVKKPRPKKANKAEK